MRNEKLKNLDKNKLIVVLFIFTVIPLFLLKAVVAGSLLKIEIPLFIRIFILIMGVQIAVTAAFVNEIKKATYSKIWNRILIGDFFCWLIVIIQAMLLYKLYSITLFMASIHFILVLSAFFDVAGHFFVNIPLYLLIKPILRKKINLFKIEYLIFYLVSAMVTYLFSASILDLKFPSQSNFIPLFIFVLVSLFFLFYFVYHAFFISKSYAKIGFVYKPFYVAGFGGIAFVLSIILPFYYAFTYVESSLPNLFFILSLYLIVCTFSIIYYIHFIIEYPSLLQPKWKALMPFDLPKVTATITLAFLAASLYLTAKEYPNFIIYQNIPYIFIIAFLLPVFLGIILIFTYLKTISARIKLRYWVYLKYGVYIHLTVTFYVFGLEYQTNVRWIGHPSIHRIPQLILLHYLLWDFFHLWEDIRSFWF
jgi:hypothetical protein